MHVRVSGSRETRFEGGQPGSLGGPAELSEGLLCFGNDRRDGEPLGRTLIENSRDDWIIGCETASDGKLAT